MGEACDGAIIAAQHGKSLAAQNLWRQADARCTRWRIAFHRGHIQAIAARCAVQPFPLLAA
jgi:hypothetical protein